MPRVRVRIHPTGHLEVQVEGMTDDGCHALVDEAASFVGVVLRRHPLPPAPRGAVVVDGCPARPIGGSSIRVGGEPGAK